MLASLCSVTSRVGYTKLLLLLPVILNSVAAQTCYWPNGNVASGWTSCNQAASVSSCCNADQVCLDNGYCLDQKSFGNRLKRGACTDKTFGNGCPRTCTDVAPGGAWSLLLMGDFDPGSYCCGNAVNGKCSFATGGSSDPFPGPGNGAVINNRENGSTGPNTTIASTVATTVTTTGSAGGTPVVTAGGSTTQTCAPISSSSSNHDVAIGAGVGVSMGVLLAALTALLFMQIRKRKEAERQLQEASVATTGARPEGWPVGYKSELHGQHIRTPYETPDQTPNAAELRG